ncbi:MAG: hypothetical protein ACK2UK_03710 [Candidatus Promineifilaceae bacterium]
MAPVVSQSIAIHRRWLIIGSMAAAALLGFLLYSRALQFAFFNDDPSGHFAWMESRSYFDYFRSSADYGYYRPVVFTTLQAFVDAFAYDAQAFHALLLALHAANTALLWLLARRLSGSSGYAWAAAVFFAAAPFGYEAVAYVASLTHPLLLFWLLLTLLFYQQARRTKARGLRLVFFGLALVSLLLGLLTHENGLFIPLALVGVEWLERPPEGLRDALKRPFWPYLLVTPIFLLIWWSIPKTSEQVLPSLSGWVGNVIPFLQTLVYPLLPLFSLTAEQTAALWLLAFVALVLTLLAAWWARAINLWLFGLGWFVFSALPATLFLSPDYLYGSPRLHYLPAVGVALLWALPILGLARHWPLPGWERLLTATAGLIYVLAVAWPPLFFINCELDFYNEASDIVRQMAALGSEAPAERPLLLVNVPVFFSSFASRPEGCQNSYPWTPVGAVVQPVYAQARDFIRFNGGPDRPAAAVFVEAYSPGWRSAGDPLTPDELHAHLADSAVYVFDLNRGAFFDLSAAWRPGEPVPGKTLATFDERLALTAVSSEVDSSGALAVTSAWQSIAEDSETASPVIFMHLYDESGRLVAQHDGPPADGFVPLGWWQAGDEIVDRRALDLPPDLPPGTYTAGIGVYDPISGSRYAAVDASGALPEDVYADFQLTLP